MTVTYSVHTYSYCSVHHHCTDGEHQQRDGKSNTGILCMTEEAIYYILLYTLKAVIKAVIHCPQRGEETMTLYSS